jgi:polyhydroxybutyrate depolymerase
MLIGSTLLGLCSLLAMPALAGDETPPTGPLRRLIWERRHPQSESQATAGETRAKITAPGDHDYSIEFGGITRRYRVHVPKRYDAAKPAALLLSFHGGGGFMEYQANDENYGQISKSEQEGFIVVFPNGVTRLKSGKLATWNAGSCCAWARDENIDDVGFTKQVIDNVQAQLTIDRNRVFATGISNGGMMAYRLACELAGTIKAVASVAGTIGVTECHPREPVAILHIHARNDDHVLFSGGAGPKAQDSSKVPQFVSVPDNMARWVKTNQCHSTPRRVLEVPGAYCERYNGCQGGASVELCVTDVGGHSWPGALKSRGEPTSKAISANDVMWDFFNGH